jgi:colanic acid biosynthesis glycosyl transferase WcaI
MHGPLPRASGQAAAATRLRILVYGINFPPEPTGVGKYTGEMCQWLAARGHEVRVVTAPPWFPAWATMAPHSASRYAREEGPGLEVLRVPLWLPRRPSGAKRLVTMLSFAASSLPPMLARIPWRPDVVWTVAPSLAGAPLAWLVARLARAGAWLHVQDLEVDAAFGLALLKGGAAQRLALAVERWILGRFDRVSTISRPMAARLRDKGVDGDRCRHFPNWADIGGIRPLRDPSPFRRELGIPAEAVVALYSGSMGAKQGLEILADSARLLASEEGLHFVFCGEGVGRASLETAAAGLERIHWLPLQPAERLNDLLGLADIHLLPQRGGASDLVMPSKLTGMLASGRPIVATAAEDTALAHVVADCGTVVAPEDATEFAAALRALAADPERRAALGARARAVAEAELACDQILGAFEAELIALARRTGRGARGGPGGERI